MHCSNGTKNYKFSSTVVSMILGFEELKYSIIALYLHCCKCSNTNMSLSSFSLYQSSWNRLIAQRLPKAQKQNSHKTKRKDNTYTTRQHWKEKKNLIINHLIPHQPRFPTYPSSFSPCYFRHKHLGIFTSLIEVYFSLLSQLRSDSSLFF